MEVMLDNFTIRMTDSHVPEFEEYEDHELRYRDSPPSTVSSSDAKTPRGNSSIS